jgi:hypothetical protein
LLLGYWFYNYIIWFYPLLLVAVIQPPRQHRETKTLTNSAASIEIDATAPLSLVDRHSENPT